MAKYNKGGKTSSNGKSSTPSRVDRKYADLLRGKSPNGSFKVTKKK